MEERTKGAYKFMNDLHEKRGLFLLGRLGLGEKFHLYLKKPIESAVHLKGLNIRVSPMYLQLVKGLGGNPVVIPPTEVYVALERNVVDGFCWPAVGIRDWGWQKQVKYIVDPGFYQVPNPLVMNLNTWKKLPKKFRISSWKLQLRLKRGPLPTLTSWRRMSVPSSLRKGSR